eukprot:11781487-Heterocapsa_arctica.AAC.1
MKILSKRDRAAHAHRFGPARPRRRLRHLCLRLRVERPSAAPTTQGRFAFPTTAWEVYHFYVDCLVKSRRGLAIH